MSSRDVVRRGAPWLPFLASAVLLLPGCGTAGDAPTGSPPDGGATPAAEGRSTAADALIEKARTPEERRALEKARDDVDAEMREKVRALDAEIERLQKENERLRKASADAR